MKTIPSRPAGVQPRRILARLAGTLGRLRPADLGRALVVPALALAAFLLLWSAGASQLRTSLGALPGPVQVWEQAAALWAEHRAGRQKEAAFYQRLRKRVAAAEAAGAPPERIARLRAHRYTGPETFIDQVLTSLATVATGFLLASLIAIPLGVVIGLNTTLYQAFNPLIQLFKPVSPLAWLPLVTLVVSALYAGQDGALSKAFLTSAITVTLCCLWPTLVNTAVGVAGVSKELLDVSRVLRLGWITKTVKIVLPSAVPMMFTGLRLSLGIGWMVLIAAEMLAQNPGLGKFVWDEFQNGSSNSLARIMVAILAIGLIGFLLDRGMLALQRAVSWDRSAVLR